MPNELEPPQRAPKKNFPQEYPEESTRLVADHSSKPKAAFVFGLLLSSVQTIDGTNSNSSSVTHTHTSRRERSFVAGGQWNAGLGGAT